LHVGSGITHILLQKNNFYLSKESSWKDKRMGVGADVEKPWGVLSVPQQERWMWKAVVDVEGTPHP